MVIRVKPKSEWKAAISFTSLDNTIIIIYFAIVLTIGIYYSRHRDKNVKQYFLADKNLGWLAVGASLFATNISSEHLVGLAGAGSLYGLGVGHFEFVSALILLLLGWFFAPIILRADVNTMPQFFGKRFDDRSRIYLTIISVFVYLFIKVGVTILAGGIVLKAVMGWDTFTSAILLVLLTGLYTVIGGMYAVVYTQVFQTILIIASAFLLSLFGYLEVGGFSNLYASLPHDYFQLLKPLSDQNIPWTGILFGAPILGIWYWCSDQYIVQRIISAKGLKQARRGTLLASLLKIFPVFLLIFPGLIAASLYPGLEGDNAYALLLGGPLLPMGIKGMVLAGFFAALMSSLSSAFNSAASLFSLDIYNLIKPKASEEELVLVGRLTTVVFVIAAISIIPLTKLINTGIYIQLQILQAYIAPPIVSVFLLGIFWKNASGRGAIWALIVGGSVGAVKIVLMTLDQGVLESFYILNELNQINYLHFAVVLLILSSLIMISVSITGKKEKDSTAIEKPNQVKTNIPVSSSVNQIKQIEINSKNKGELVHK